MSFQRVAPQKVLHDSGSIVQFVGRYELEFIDSSGRIVSIEVDDSDDMVIFEKSISTWKRNDIEEAPITVKEKSEILEIVEGALRVMGVNYTLK